MQFSTRAYRRLIGVIVAVVSVTLSVVVLVPLRNSVNATTIALLQLLVVVIVATFFQRWAALTASVLAAFAFNYFFLPPLYTLTISEEHNWVALIVFLAVAITVGHLSATSNKRRAQAERLYKELEDAFESASEAEALRRSEKLKTALLDAVTHDFRTPLTSVKASITALIDDNQLPRADRTLDQHSRGELLQVIDEESDRLNTFVESMVELARFQSGDNRLERATVAPEEVVLKAARRARSLRPSHTLRSDIEPDLPAVSADSRALVEAVYNLIENAAKYSPAGTTIQIAAARHNGDVRFFVEDEGTGIPKSEREAVFQRFYRGEDDGRGGLGMGLAIVRGIIEAHGGRIWVEAGAKGARFVFDLPTAENGR
jgi:two-component system sensor histidine kinase KdpD